MAEQRRDIRYSARILARISRRHQMVEFLTNDVSFRGVFIRTDAPLALRQLLKFELVLPEKVMVSGHAMVVHVAARPDGQGKGEGPVPGMGLQFWGPIVHGKEWEKFIHDLKSRERAGIAAAKATDRVRRASERFKLAIRDLRSGKDTATVTKVGIGNPVWTSDSKGIVYTEVNDQWRSYRAQYHRVGDDPAKAVTLYEERDDIAFSVGVARSTDDSLIFISTGNNSSNEVRFVPADNPSAPLTLVKQRQPEIQYDADAAHEGRVVLADEDHRAAPRPTFHPHASSCNPGTVAC